MFIFCFNLYFQVSKILRRSVMIYILMNDDVFTYLIERIIKEDRDSQIERPTLKKLISKSHFKPMRFSLMMKPLQ